jgi:hypothetical protein
MTDSQNDDKKDDESYDLKHIAEDLKILKEYSNGHYNYKDPKEKDTIEEDIDLLDDKKVIKDEQKPLILRQLKDEYKEFYNQLDFLTKKSKITQRVTLRRFLDKFVRNISQYINARIKIIKNNNHILSKYIDTDLNRIQLNKRLNNLKEKKKVADALNEKKIEKGLDILTTSDYNKAKKEVNELKAQINKVPDISKSGRQYIHDVDELNKLRTSFHKQYHIYINIDTTEELLKDSNKQIDGINQNHKQGKKPEEFITYDQLYKALNDLLDIQTRIKDHLEIADPYNLFDGLGENSAIVFASIASIVIYIIYLYTMYSIDNIEIKESASHSVLDKPIVKKVAFDLLMQIMFIPFKIISMLLMVLVFISIGTAILSTEQTYTMGKLELNFLKRLAIILGIQTIVSLIFYLILIYGVVNMNNPKTTVKDIMFFKDYTKINVIIIFVTSGILTLHMFIADMKPIVGTSVKI